MEVLFTGKTNGSIRRCIEHSHNCYEIIITTSGEGICEVEGKKYGFSKDTVMIIPPHMRHLSYSETLFSDMYIQTEEIGDVIDKPVSFSDDSGMIENLSNMLYIVWIQKEANYKTICNFLLKTIGGFITKYRNEKYAYSFIRALKDAITLNLNDPKFNIVSACKELGFSGDYIRHCFKKEMGITPLEYLTKIRIDQAKCYLIDSEYYNISQISCMCGFSDPYYFSRCFKKNTGLSPREYRIKNSIRDKTGGGAND